jgi:hypothetical protein
MQLLFGMPHANHSMCCQKVRRVVLEMVPSGRVCIEIGSVPRLSTLHHFDRTKPFSSLEGLVLPESRHQVRTAAGLGIRSSAL